MYHSEAIGNFMPLKRFKTTNCKIVHLSFSDTFTQSVTKNMRKTAIWTTSYFWLFPLLNNVKKEQAKLGSSYVMGCQYCIEEDGELLNTIFKTSIFCY